MKHLCETLVRERYWRVLLLLLSFGCCISCSDDNATTAKYDPSKPVTFERFSPEKGGSTTQLVITGSNFGNDTTLVKVQVGNRKAKVVGVSPTKIYAVVKARSVDASGETNIQVTVGDNKPFTFEKKFNYELMQMVSTFAGKGSQGQADGNALSATFDSPTWMTLDNDGILYVIEEYGGLRTISQDGSVTTLFAHTIGRKRAIDFNADKDTLYMGVDQNGIDNPPVYYMIRDNGFSNPRGAVRGISQNCNTVAVNPIDGYIFWTQWNNGMVYYCDPKNPTDYKMADTFNRANDLESFCCWGRDGKTFYHIVKGRHVIYRCAYDPVTHQFVGNEEVLAGKWGESGFQNGSGEEARLWDPWQLVEDEEGNVYVSDRGNHVIRKITPEKVVSIYAGSHQQGFVNGLPLRASFNHPEGITMDKDGVIYVADRDNRVIRKILIE